MRVRVRIAVMLMTVATGAWLSAQQPATGQPAAGGGAAPQHFWVQKAKGAYTGPHKPITRLSDLKAKYKGQSEWREIVVKDGELQAEYQAVAPGTKVSPRMHPGTASFLVVFEGEMSWQIENQQPFTAKRGSIVNIPMYTIFSYEVTSSVPAVFVEMNPIHFDTIYPASEPPPAALPGREVIKAAFNGRRPAPYVGPNKPHWNLHDSIVSNPARPGGVQVLTDHLYANANYGFADPNDPANPNRGAKPNAARPAGPGGPHLHPGNAEWWIVLVGQIQGKFETGEVIGSEGDILYAPPYMLHQMSNYGPGGSCRVAIGWFNPDHFDPVRSGTSQ
jgi:mannose-6-phosphate isomerase-like protein (cupin superfamily)